MIMDYHRHASELWKLQGEDTLVNEKLVGYILGRQFERIADSSTNKNALDVFEVDI